MFLGPSSSQFIYDSANSEEVLTSDEKVLAVHTFGTRRIFEIQMLLLGKDEPEPCVTN